MGIENRRWERLGERGTIFIETLSSGDRPQHPTTIVICSSVEISARGLRVCLDDALETGAILQLGVQFPELERTLYLVGEVRWCSADSERPGRHSVGFELLESDGTDYRTWCDIVGTDQPGIIPQ